MSALRIESCFVSQHGLRNISQLKDMIEFVKNGGRFNEESLNPPGPLIHIARFEDGQFFIQDGHHRMCAMVLAGRPFMFEDEFYIKDWTYKEFLDINFNCGWVTPYDPRIETRSPDYAIYKKMVNDNLKISKNHAVTFIAQNRQLYSSQRSYYHIQALIEWLDLAYLKVR